MNFTVLPENDVRDKISQEFSSQAGQYDVATVSNFEIPIYATSKWIAPLSDYIAKDTAFDQDDILKPMTESLSKDGVVYGEPFYGESSFLMYRKDVLDSKGITMPPNPTWEEVADIAAKVDGAQPNMKGICLRGQPGWGQIFAPLTTVVNTFGGTWFEKDWTPGVNAQPFVDATNFYVNLVQKHGEKGAAGGVHRVPEQPRPGQRAMVRRDVGGRLARGGGLGQGQDRLRRGAGEAHQELAVRVGWGIQMASTKKDNAWKFVSWASSKEYEELVGEQLGWSKVPAGKRASTYDNPDYLKVAGGVRRRRPRPPSSPTRTTRACSRDRRRDPVHRHPRVPRPRHPGLPGRQLGDRRPDERPGGAEHRSSSPRTWPTGTSPRVGSERPSG